ncbi:hypothetical protein CH373_18415 [Leptospira perolatii]|uniref:Uncharacterized protein n=1 Tax=Leptospira perolatii TaxID=2023191 RepID=A0A2M9ZHW0_9LEPT|nr:hypothetical protein [Leptospira perolatii]PJZ68008.1 hypothetical protein CH360_18430 [Leptospira perolatii]PJZ71639.1 hypothetical protein CH373_18415 [Leptospira perolatii]
MQINTALSDLLLAVVALFAAYRLHMSAKGNINKLSGAWGLYSIALGAAFGSLFFFGFSVIEPVYRPIARFAAEVGVPWLGLGFLGACLVKINHRTWATVSGVLIVLFILDVMYRLGNYSLIIGALSFIIVIVSCIRKYGGQNKIASLYGILGALLFIFAGLFIGTQGEAGGIPRIDLYHFALSGASYCLGFSLKRLG